MNPERNYFRISVHLDRFYEDHRAICRIFVHTDKMKTIGSLRKHITNLFKIENFYMKSNNQYLPDPEDIRILDEGEIVHLIPIIGKNHYLKDVNNEKVESESEADVEVKEKKKKRKKKKKVEEESMCKKKKMDFDPVANSTIFSKAAPIINVIETPIKTLAMEVVEENPQEETPNTFKNKKQKKLITILSNNLIKKAGEGSSIKNSTKNTTVVSTDPANSFIEVEVHTIPKNKVSIGQVDSKKEEKNSLGEGTDFITPNCKEKKNSNLLSHVNSNAFQSFSNTSSIKERTNLLEQKNCEPPTSTMDIQTSTNHITNRNSSVNSQPIKTPDNMNAYVSGMKQGTPTLNSTFYQVDEKSIKGSTKNVSNNSFIPNIVNKNLNSSKKLDSASPTGTKIETENQSVTYGPIKNQESFNTSKSSPIGTHSIQGSVENVNVGLESSCQKSSSFNMSRKNSAKFSFVERMKSIQPVTVLEKRTNIVKTIIASNNCDDSVKVEDETVKEGANVGKKSDIEGEQSVEGHKSFKDVIVEQGKENRVELEDEVAMEVEECGGEDETETDSTGKLKILKNSFEVSSTNINCNEGNSLNVEPPESGSNTATNFSIVNDSGIQEISATGKLEDKPGRNSQIGDEINEASTQIQNSHISTNNLATISTSQFNDSVNNDETLQINNFDSNFSTNIQPNRIFNIPKSCNISVETNSHVSDLEQNHGIGSVMESLKSDSSGLDTSRDCITKRKRVRTRKRKKVVNKLLGNSPTVVMKTPFLHPNVQSKPLIHIRFDEMNETQDIETIEINDSVMVIEESQQDIEKNDIREVETLRESQSFNLSKEISKLPSIENLKPEENKVITFKMLKIGEDYTPTVSNSITANIKSFNEDTKEVSLCILDGLDEFEKPLGKFSLEEDQEISDDNELVKILNWENLIEPRLMFE